TGRAPNNRQIWQILQSIAEEFRESTVTIPTLLGVRKRCFQARDKRANCRLVGGPHFPLCTGKLACRKHCGVGTGPAEWYWLKWNAFDQYGRASSAVKVLMLPEKNDIRAHRWR